ncbi:hypothetical protein DNTS_016987 [Danionella cerebrum]|uniref:Methyltransferase-like protein 17, mitochondrial n=1 Tax=Danionella cerebrum TaxID=2873325 RepID=A0A553R9S0_9TELE|nr:hypothetical protein DNTS_016987 [Danionella translucida]
MFSLGRRKFVRCLRYNVRVPSCLKESVVCQSSAKPLATADFLKGALHKKHPGLTNLKTIKLPEKLEQAALSILQGRDVKALSVRAHKLTNFLWSRKREISDSKLRENAILLEKKYFALEEDVDIDNVEPGFGALIRKNVLCELRRTTCHRIAIRYNEDIGMVYMMARLAGGYAAVFRALSEIKKREASFAPCSLLDFGSGLGTGAWASHSLWGDSLNEFVCVDSSGDMNRLAEKLLVEGSEEEKPAFKHVYFRQFLPVSPEVQFDLVVAAFSLSELANLKERINTVTTLWTKTKSYLVLVENGTKDGHQLLMEAKDAILKAQEEKQWDPRKPSVFAPCTHQQTCPKLTEKYVLPCNFPQFYNSLKSKSLQTQEKQLERFSYLILSRSEEDTAQNPEPWHLARIISQVHCRTRHVQCKLCCADGKIKQLTISTRRQGKDMYRCARNSNWGDLLPVFVEKDGDVENEDL